MNDEKLTQLNELSSKIKGEKYVLDKIRRLSDKDRIEINGLNFGIVLPEELRDVFSTLLKDYHQKQLDALEKEFEEM